jgi:hypothetical protein
MAATKAEAGMEIRMGNRPLEGRGFLAIGSGVRQAGLGWASGLDLGDDPFDGADKQLEILRA